jgi:hypothetical protein
MTPPKLKTAQALLLIVVVTLLNLGLIQTAFSQGSSNTKVAINPETTNAIVGEIITINITLSDVQNLYGIDVTLLWNPSALTFQNVNIWLGVESNPDGVLHEASSADIFVQENTADQDRNRHKHTSNFRSNHGSLLQKTIKKTFKAKDPSALTSANYERVFSTRRLKHASSEENRVAREPSFWFLLVFNVLEMFVTVVFGIFRFMK